MYDEIIKRIKNFVLENKSLLFSILISIISISLSITYVQMNKCKPCTCKKNKNTLIQKTKNIKNNNIFVDVKGAVVNPGVYKLSDNNLVQDAINSAGGLTNNGTTSNINLSKKLTNEMVIYVFSNEEIQKDVLNNEIVCEVPKCECETISYNDNESHEKTLTEKVSINKASIDELSTLTGIGPSKAKKIIEYREANGGFKTIEEIKNVSGIGDKAFEKIKDNITT